MDRREAGCVLLALGVLAAWVAWTQSLRPQPFLDGDEAYHALNAMGLTWWWRDSYPPLGYVPAALGGPTWEGVVRAQAAWLALAGLGAYGIARRLSGIPAAAVAGVLVVTSPAAAWQVRLTMLDLPLAAMTALSVWALLESDERPWLAGLTAGLALLTKWSWIFFGGVAWLAVLLVRRPGWRWTARAAGVALAVAGPWYLLNFDLVAGRLVAHTVAGDNLATHALANLGQFARETLPALGLLLLLAVPLTWRQGWPVWAALVGGCGITVAVLAAGPRYLLPGWPLALALVAAGLGRWGLVPLAAFALWQAGLAVGLAEPGATQVYATQAFVAEPDPRVLVAPEALSALGGSDVVWAASDPDTPGEEFLQVFALERGLEVLFLRIYRGPQGLMAAPAMGVEATRRVLPGAGEPQPLATAPRPQAVLLLYRDPGWRAAAVRALEGVLGGPLVDRGRWDGGEVLAPTAPRAAP